MKSSKLSLRALSALSVVVAVGCQGILGIEDGVSLPGAAGANAAGSAGASTGDGGASNGGAVTAGTGGLANGSAGEGAAAGQAGDTSSAGNAGAGGEPDTGPVSVAINEVESNDGSPGDWVEFVNYGASVVNISGFVFKDSDDSHHYIFPSGTTIAPGAFFVVEEATFNFGLGSVDAARLYRPDGTTLVDGYSWTQHALTTFGRCADGVGAFRLTATPTKGLANACTPHVVVNEVESSGGLPGDWIELYNKDAAPADISGWVIKDNDDTHVYTILPNTVIAPGGYFVFDEAQLGFALGSGDSARLFAPGASAPVDSYTWIAHATTTYGRCPDGSGAFTTTVDSTKGVANQCVTGSTAWPGTNAIAIADGDNVFGSNLSGLHFEPGASAAEDVLWGIRNNPSTLYRLKSGGMLWTPDTQNGWSAGKSLHYPNGTGSPDAEGVTRPDWALPSVYVATERDNDAGTVSRPSVLRFVPAGAGTSFDATDEWNLATDLPAVGANEGLEGITWLPDTLLTGKGFYDERLQKVYSPADYANHGNGLFLVGLEANGGLYIYALYPGGGFQRVATIAPPQTRVNDVSLDRETGYLWSFCGATCANKSDVFEIDTRAGSATLGRFIPRATFQAPAALSGANEGTAFASEARCAAGKKAFLWADDAATAGHSLRSDFIPCGTFLP